MKQNYQGVVNWALAGFSIAVILINAALSYAFGRIYLGAAFGIQGWMGSIVGGLYAVLVADVAFLVWFWAYKRTADTRNQRSMSLLFGCMALGLSIAMSVNQLAVHSYGLVDLTAYHDSVGLLALTVVIVVTAVHIAGSAAFNLSDAAESVKGKSADIRAKLVDESLQGVESSMDDIRVEVVRELQKQMRRDVLMEMGFGPGSMKTAKKFQPPSPPGINGRSSEAEPLH